MAASSPQTPEVPELDELEATYLEAAPEEVEVVAQQRLEADPSDGIARAYLGLVQWEQGNVAAAQGALKDGFERLDEPDRLALANHLLDLQDSEETLFEAAHFIVDALKVEHPPALRVLAQEMALLTGDPVAAIALLKRSLKVDGTDPESHYLAAHIFARLGKRANVLSHLHKALDNSNGIIAVRQLARLEPDFDGLRDDPEFATLMDVFPAESKLRSLYEALDAGDFDAVGAKAEELLPSAEHPLDVLYPWREAVEQQLDIPLCDEVALADRRDELNQRISALEAVDADCPAYSRFCGDS